MYECLVKKTSPPPQKKQQQLDEVKLVIKL